MKTRSMMAAILALCLLMVAVAAVPAIAESADAAPAVRYFVTNGTWRYAETMPLYNAVDEILYLDTAVSENAVVSENGTIASTNSGKLSQLMPEAAEVALAADASLAELDETKALTFSSADLYSMYTNDIIGVPTATLYLTAASEGTVDAALEVVNADGTVSLLAAGKAIVAAGEQTVTLDLTRAYDNGEDSFEFVAWEINRAAATVRLVVYSTDTDITVSLGGEKASYVAVPFVDHDENGYNGVFTLDGTAYDASMYWLESAIYVNYDANSKWYSIPADTVYTMDAQGAADFGSFTFLPEGNAFKDGIEQTYDGSAENTQPFPSVRHVVVDTVDVTAVSDTLYAAGTKVLKYDLFLPTAGDPAGDAPALIIYLHGYNGSYSALPDFLKECLADGYAVAGVDFRNTPPNFSPDYDQDIKGAIRSLRANAAAYGIDPDRFAVYGASNGGFTALAMLLTNENDEYMEGTVGGYTEVSSRVQAGLVGYGASDYLYFGADQRSDNVNDAELLRGMIQGGDGETAPCAQMANWYGPGKGLLMLRNYYEERQAAEEAGTLDAFLAEDYTLVIDEDYIAKWFPWEIGGGLGFGGSTVATLGTYTYTHEELETALANVAAASPITYVTPDDTPVGLFAGFGGKQNITNNQSTRTLKALSLVGVEGFMYANTLGNYGNEEVVKAGMKNYLDEYLKTGVSGTKLVLTLGKQVAALNYRSVKTDAVMIEADGQYLLPAAFVAEQFGVDAPAAGDEGVTEVDGVLYIDTAAAAKLTGATVTEYANYGMVALVKAAPAAAAAKSTVVEDEKVSKYGQYSGYEDETYPGYVVKSLYVEVPAWYEEAYRSDPDYEGDTVKLAVDYVLPADADGNVVDGQFPAVVLASRGGRFVETDGNGNGPVAINLVQHGYAYICIEMRGCGASFGVNDSFASVENRLDVKYVMEHWAKEQSWYNGKFATMGGSNRGLIQEATAAVQPEGMVAMTPVVCNADFYHQDYINGVSACPSGMKLSGTSNDPTPKSYEEWKSSTTTKFVDDDPDGEQAYEAYVQQTLKNKAFSTYLLLPNMERDTANEELYGEVVNLTIPPIEYAAEIVASEIKQHQLSGYYDSNITYQVMTTNAWGGTIVMGPWNHGNTIRGIGTDDTTNFDVATDYLRWFDYCLKDKDNGYEEAPSFYYYVVNAAAGQEWRYADTMAPDNAVYSDLYLATASEDIDVADALQLNGAQSNNGKLTPSKPEAESAIQYRVDTSVTMPSDYTGMNLTSAEALNEYVDVKALTFTSAPVAAASDIVGIPTIDMWVSCDNADDVDFIAYLEVVDADGTSHYLSRACQRASHRTTAENSVWDSTEGLAGRYHPSMTADVEACLAEGLKEPVHLMFNFDLISYEIKAGQSLRVSVTTSLAAMYQSTMYYDIVDGQYVVKAEEDLPLISLYTGGDKASYISIPVIQKRTDTFNGTVTLLDGSYSGPATMYLFEKNWYLYYDGMWKKLPVGSDLCAYTVKDNAAIFENAGFSFLIEGSGVANGIAQSYKGGAANSLVFPTKSQLYVATVDIQTVSEALYLPTTKELYIDFFAPDESTGHDPLLIFIHGYGGSTNGLDAALVDFISEGYAVAGVDLRNYPSNYSPDYYQDVKAGIRYLRAHAETLGVDPDKFCTYGRSLGGNTALMMAVTNGNEFMEGTVGDCLDVSSDVQGAVVGFGWSDALNFGADQRSDNEGDPALLAGMISGGDGENAPCAQAIDWYGPGKGYLNLRLYVEAREAAEAAGTLDAFLAEDYTFTVDEAYVQKWYPSLSANLFTADSNTFTLGTYTFTHEELMAAVERAHAASPLYYISSDDPVILVYGGFGGKQNITNNQSVRTLHAMQDAGVKCFYVGNAQGNYGTEESNVAMIKEYLAEYFPVAAE